ncbi:MAG: hypothetical protein RL216_542 [Pseudomonadota bacterium]
MSPPPPNPRNANGRPRQGTPANFRRKFGPSGPDHSAALAIGLFGCVVQLA